MLEVARGPASQGCKVAVLNMAAKKHPGGGVRSGAGAQEENLHRRSDAFRFLERQVQGEICIPSPPRPACLARRR
eukprot:13865419-Alexandrium_andersonii.AAC.1